jgi:pimeloyl-ACP methyl ester carboxylesterase
MNEDRLMHDQARTGSRDPVQLEVGLPGIRFAAWRWSPPAGIDPAGRRLVIFHGVTSSSLAFDGVAKAIAGDGWTVDALDLPGHAGTRWTDEAGTPLADQERVDRSAYDLAHVGALAAAAVRALPPPVRGRGGRDGAGDGYGATDRSPAPPSLPVVLGHSWGAGVAVMAVDAGMPTDRLVLEDPPFLTPEQGAAMADGFRSELGAGIPEGVVYRSDDDEMGADATSETSPLAADAIARGAPWDPFALLAGWRARHPDLRVDVIAGDASVGGLIPAAMLQVLRVALGPERVHQLPGLGHSPHREDPERFLEVLRRVME